MDPDEFDEQEREYSSHDAPTGRQKPLLSVQHQDLEDSLVNDVEHDEQRFNDSPRQFEVKSFVNELFTVKNSLVSVVWRLLCSMSLFCSYLRYCWDLCAL